jgi:hypothetical protein
MPTVKKAAEVTITGGAPDTLAVTGDEFRGIEQTLNVFQPACVVAMPQPPSPPLRLVETIMTPS